VKDITYPTVERIIEYNYLALTLIKVKRADEPKVLDRGKLIDVLARCQDAEGDIYDKAVCLLTGLVQKHPFASGNRRTAFIAAKGFLVGNGAPFRIKDEPKMAKVLLGIREGYYSNNEVKELA